MAKIPRIDLGGAPSAISTSPVPAEASLAVGAEILGGVLADEANAAAAEEAALEKARLKALEQKQAIVDESDSGRISSQFEASNFGLMDELKEKYSSDPAKALDEYRKQAREMSDLVLKDSPNDTVRLMARKDSESAISSGVRQMHEWVSGRQTQRVRENLMGEAQDASAIARTLTNPNAVNAHVEKFAKKNEALYSVAFGKDAENKLREAKSDIVFGWGLEEAEANPAGFLNYSKGAPKLLSQNLSTEKYDSLVRRARAAIPGIGKRAKEDIFLRSVEKGSKDAEAFLSGSLDASAILARQKELTAQIDAIKTSPTFTPEQKEGQIQLVKMDRQALDIMDEMRLAGTKNDPIGNEDNLPADVARMRKDIFGSTRGDRAVTKKPIETLMEYRNKIWLAIKSREITPGVGTNLLKEVDLNSVGALNKKREDGAYFEFAATPDELASNRADDLFKANAPSADEAERNRVTSKFVELKLDFVGKGGNWTNSVATALADEAFAIVRGIPYERKDKK